MYLLIFILTEAFNANNSALICNFFTKNISNDDKNYKYKHIELTKTGEYKVKTELEEKIIIQRISGGDYPIVAALDNNKYRTFASINNIVLKDEYKDLYKLIVALLNSNVINWYYANNFSNKSTNINSNKITSGK